MKSLLALPLLFAAVSGCRQIAGVHDIVYADAGVVGDGGSGPCTGATTVIATISDYDGIATGSGFVFAEVTNAGVARCAAGSTCTDPAQLLVFPPTDTFEAFTVSPSSALVYTLEGPSANKGSIHTAAPDGTNDQVVLSGLAYPTGIVVSGTRTFWVDDPYFNTGNPDTLQCTGCNGVGPTPWITGLAGGAYGLYADASAVYLLADDATQKFTLYDCPVTAACGTTPQTLLTGLDPTTTIGAMIASDGTDLYVGRNDHADLVRIGRTSALAPLVTGTQVYAVAADSATGNVYYGTDQSTLWRVKSDGSGKPEVVATCDSFNDTVQAVAVDATNVYMLVTTPTGSLVVGAPK